MNLCVEFSFFVWCSISVACGVETETEKTLCLALFFIDRVAACESQCQVYTFNNLAVQQTVTVGDVDCYSFFGGEILQSHASYNKKRKQIQLFAHCRCLSPHTLHDMENCNRQRAIKKHDADARKKPQEKPRSFYAPCRSSHIVNLAWVI